MNKDLLLIYYLKSNQKIFCFNNYNCLGLFGKFVIDFLTIVKIGKFDTEIVSITIPFLLR